MHRSVLEVVEEMGGVVSRSGLVARTSRGAVDRAVASGDIVRVGRSRLATAELDGARRLAGRVGGVLAATDAALLHGWEVAHTSRLPHIIVPRGRRIPRVAAEVHRVDLGPHEHTALATVPEVTLRHSMRWLPFGDALAIADSALRHSVDPHVLQRIAAAAAGPGSPQVRRVAREATGLAANPFESGLRAICLDVPGLHVRPQVWVSDQARADLVDESLRLVIEAESFTWHGQRPALEQDARRYNRMIVDGWLVLRFCYDDVMNRSTEVHQILLEAVEAARMHTQPRRRRSATPHRPG